jgi:perosamine synthetase
MKRISELEKNYVLSALENQFETSKNNIYTKKMEEKFSDIFQCKYSISHTNGTATMHTALNALGIGVGDEVIVPPLTMASTSLCVLHNGSIPVFADVDELTYNISPKSILDKITSKTKAIITVALYGLSPEYDEILEICNSNNIYLIEDNAECFLGYYKNKLVGTFGDFASYSFQASKHITCGEGGILTTNNLNWANDARKFTSLGYGSLSADSAKITKNEIQNPNFNRHVSIGFNYRMSELQSAVILGQLERINELVSIRTKSANYFLEALSGSDLLIPQHTPDYCVNSYWSFACTLNTSNPENDWIKFRQLFLNLGGDPYYAAWRLTYQEDLFKNKIQSMKNIYQNYNDNLCPNAEFLQKRIKAFKTNYWNLEEAEKQATILNKAIKSF